MTGAERSDTHAGEYFGALGIVSESMGDSKYGDFGGGGCAEVFVRGRHGHLGACTDVKVQRGGTDASITNEYAIGRTDEGSERLNVSTSELLLDYRGSEGRALRSRASGGGH